MRRECSRNAPNAAGAIGLREGIMQQLRCGGLLYRLITS